MPTLGENILNRYPGQLDVELGVCETEELFLIRENDRIRGTFSSLNWLEGKSISLESSDAAAAKFMVG